MHIMTDQTSEYKYCFHLGFKMERGDTAHHAKRFNAGAMQTNQSCADARCKHFNRQRARRPTLQRWKEPACQAHRLDAGAGDQRCRVECNQACD